MRQGPLDDPAVLRADILWPLKARMQDEHDLECSISRTIMEKHSMDKSHFQIKLLVTNGFRHTKSAIT